jgi:hypothetical protein
MRQTSNAVIFAPFGSPLPLPVCRRQALLMFVVYLQTTPQVPARQLHHFNERHRAVGGAGHNQPQPQLHQNVVPPLHSQIPQYFDHEQKLAQNAG